MGSRKQGPKKKAPQGRIRIISRVVATKPGCAPLKKAYEQAVATKPTAWGQIEDAFLRGMEAFDDNVASGVADMGDLQNGKGDFFNDLLTLLLENCAQVKLYSRGGVPGLIFPKHNLDVTYPSEGTIEFILEAKAVGTPKHKGSPRAKPIGRPGSADLDKRIKEIGFKAIDLKGEYGRIMAEKGDSASVMGGDLTAWLRSVKPRSYVFFAARVVSDKDLERVIRLVERAALLSDAVGVFCFRPISPDQPTRYQAATVPTPIELGRVLYRAGQELVAIKKSIAAAAKS